ncbi:unnamed protein product [Notodromas monacha]|uniref:Uncharacterized protein n=1 Tax=Notodromas monacha TaxID=399045 RepID=A0A7R9BWS8_9CRUS|nr:unnamed protein product [Notodromas monacha]CAG0922091.1 unnamed protein product [Notodromas monacha]
MEEDREVAGDESKPEAKAIYLELIAQDPRSLGQVQGFGQPPSPNFKLCGLNSVQDHQLPLEFWNEFPRKFHATDPFYQKSHYGVLNRLRDWGFELQAFTQNFHDFSKTTKIETRHYILCRYPSTSTSASSARQTDIQDIAVEVPANKQEDASSSNTSRPVVPSPIKNLPEDPSSAQENMLAETSVPEGNSAGSTAMYLHVQFVNNLVPVLECDIIGLDSVPVDLMPSEFWEEFPRQCPLYAGDPFQVSKVNP